MIRLRYRLRKKKKTNKKKHGRRAILNEDLVRFVRKKKPTGNGNDEVVGKTSSTSPAMKTKSIHPPPHSSANYPFESQDRAT